MKKGKTNKKIKKDEDESILLQLNLARDRAQERDIRRKYKNSRIAGYQSIRLLSSLEQLGLYFHILLFVFYLFFGYVSSSSAIVYTIYDISVFCGIFVVIFGFFGIIYSIFKAVKTKVSPVWFISLAILRIVAMIVLLIIQTVLKLFSNGGLFNV